MLVECAAPVGSLARVFPAVRAKEEAPGDGGRFVPTGRQNQASAPQGS
jgi:hypothetical protein